MKSRIYSSAVLLIHLWLEPNPGEFQSCITSIEYTRTSTVATPAIYYLNDLNPVDKMIPDVTNLCQTRSVHAIAILVQKYLRAYIPTLGY